MSKKTTWVVVADAAIARILEKPNTGGDLTPVEELTDPAIHAKDSEFRHGPYGRRGSGNNGNGASGATRGQAMVSAGDSEHHQHAQAFAARVAQRLEECRQQRRYDALHVVAAPRQLGYLRNAIGPNLAAVVVNTLDMDLVHESNEKLTQRLFERKSA